MKLVILESPYAGVGIAETQDNIKYARECMRDSLERGEAPFASHLLYTQDGILDDSDPHERNKGIMAGLIWGRNAKKTVVYTDRGISKGMQKGIEDAAFYGRHIEFRTLSKEGVNHE